MTRQDLRGYATGFLANAERLPLSLVDWMLYNSSVSVYRRIREQWHRKTQRTKYVPLVADLDLYELGTEVAELVRVERLDLSDQAERVFPHDPMRQEEAGQIVGFPRFDYPYLTYVVMRSTPTIQIRFLEIPQTTTVEEKGARIWFLPQPVPLTSDNQEPDLPSPTHEMVVVGAVERLALVGGVALAAPQQFEAFRQRAERELVGWLTPSDIDTPVAIPDGAGFYEEIF